LHLTCFIYILQVMFEIFKNTKKQGDFGLGKAIGWLCEKGFTVSLPLTDSQDYDLIVDIDDGLCRVQIKTTSYKRINVFSVSLSVKGGNKSSSKIKKFDNTKVEYVFVLTSDDEMYFIPSKEINSTSTINLGDKYKSFKIKKHGINY
jgi:hypothetical protein